MNRLFLTSLFTLAVSVSLMAKGTWVGLESPSTYTYTPRPNQDTPSRVFFADFNKDGHTDILLDGMVYGQSMIGDYIDRSYIFVNNGDGTFQKERWFDKGSKHRIVTDVKDYNADGFPDLLVADFWGNRCQIYAGKANFKFANPINLNTRTHGGTSEFHDLDGDGDLDIVSISAGSGTALQVWIFKNTNGTFSRVGTYGYPRHNGTDSFEFYQKMDVVDLDQDGLLDILVHSLSNDSLLALTQSANLAFSQKTYLKPPWFGIRKSWTSLVDINNDGYPDLQNGDKVWFNSGKTPWDPNAGDSRTLTPLTDHHNVYNYHWVDMNGDKKLDLVCRTSLLDSILVYITKGDSLEKAVTVKYKGIVFEDHEQTQSLGVHDLNNDGSPDIVAVRMDGKMEVHLSKIEKLGINLKINDNLATFTWDTIAGRRYQLQESYDLKADSWRTIHDMAASKREAYIHERILSSDEPKAFFRLMSE